MHYEGPGSLNSVQGLFISRACLSTDFSNLPFPYIFVTPKSKTLIYVLPLDLPTLDVTYKLNYKICGLL